MNRPPAEPRRGGPLGGAGGDCDLAHVGADVGAADHGGRRGALCRRSGTQFNGERFSLRLSLKKPLRSYFDTATCENYRVGHLIGKLGWIDYGLTCSTLMPR